MENHSENRTRSDQAALHRYEAAFHRHWNVLFSILRHVPDRPADAVPISLQAEEISARKELDSAQMAIALIYREILSGAHNDVPPAMLRQLQTAAGDHA